jgi:ribosomal protein S16
MKKNYPHNVIRLRKGKRIKEHIIWIIAILNKKKTKSLKIIHKLGYIQFGYKGNFMIKFNKLAFFLNKGYIMNKSVKKLLSLIIFFSKKYK